MRKYKILLNCSSSTLLRDFFIKTYGRFSCMTSSNYWEDLSAHYELFQPDAYVCIADQVDMQLISLLIRLKTEKVSSGVPIVVITDEDSREFYENEVPEIIDLVLCRPITIDAIADNIVRKLKFIEEEREKEAERKRLEEERVLAEAARLNARKQILIIDDDRAVLKLLKAALEPDYIVTTMISGNMAMKFLKTKTPDLIFLDYQMPVEDGPEVFKNIRALESSKDVPIVFLTGVADRSKIANVLMLKPQGYLLKPIDIERVNETIQRIFDSGDGEL